MAFATTSDGVRLFYDGIELDPLDPRTGGVADPITAQIWTLEDLTIERSAKITGDVEYENITIENGGHIDGRLKHMSTVNTAVAATVAPAGPRPVEAAPVSSPFGTAANEQAA